MKKYSLLAIVFSVVGLTSCNDLLELSPISNIDGDKYFKNETEVNTGVIACYSGMQNTIKWEWALTEMRSDNTRLYTLSSTDNTNRELILFDSGTGILSDFKIVQTYWENAYNNIARCNSVLSNLSVVANETSRNQFQGEALFIRSYHFFNLVRLFGPIFLTTEQLTPDQAKLMERTTVAAVYSQIESDLTTAIANLPATYPTTQIGRVTSAAAKALLAKVYLTEKKYDLAEPLLKAVITEKGDALIAYNKIFDINNEMNAEILFTIRFKSGNLGLGSPFGNYFAPYNSATNVINGNGSGYNYPTTSIVSAYETGDLRKAVSLSETYVNATTGAVIGDVAYGRYIKKYLSPVTVLYDGESDWPVLRMGDVMLMYAEVENEINGPSGDALKYLNLVRVRAGLPALTSAQIVSRADFRAALKKERRVELAFENERWFDLLRWNDAVAVINAQLASDPIYKSAKPMVEWQTILPIPLSVLNINPKAGQNTGY